jgi:hypothetical protein
VVAAACVAAALGVGIWLAVKAHREQGVRDALHTQALADCTKDTAKLATLEESYAQAVHSDAVVSALRITAEQVSDPASVQALADVVAFSVPALQACDASLTTDELTAIGVSAKADARLYDEKISEVTDAVAAVNDSKAAKESADMAIALTALNAEIKTAGALLSSSEGKTQTNAERTALSKEIEVAQTLATAQAARTANDGETSGAVSGAVNDVTNDVTSDAVESIATETAKLKAAEKSVDDAVAAKSSADAAAARAQAQQRTQQQRTQQQQTQTGGGAGSDGTATTGKSHVHGNHMNNGYVDANGCNSEGVCISG